MVDLDRNTGTIFVDLFTEFVQTRQIVVVVNTKLSSSVGTLRRIYACILYDDQTCAAFGTLFILINVKKTHFAVLFPVIGSHRHHNDTVFDSHIFYCEWCENMLVIAFHYIFPPEIFCWIYSCSVL